MRFGLVRSKSGPDFPVLSLFFVETMPDKVILDLKKSYLVYFVDLHFCDF